MAEPICEDEGLLQEWTPLTQLLQQIPLKTQRGLFSQNLNLTCLDVVPEFIALGTNLGFVYWYCRATGDLQRLRFKNCHCCVTCTKIMPFADYMVAAGTDEGTIIVFQIPKTEPGSTTDQMKSKQKQIEIFTINGLHQAPVTSIEWDSNEMKVFSGDKIGTVVLTEINLNLHISKSMELLNEQFEIVQLSYSEQILLISTVYRSVICDGRNNWKVCQVGTKERKILGKFGASSCKFQHGAVLYASRPGHRLWLSDKNGVVKQTLIFKSAIQSNCQKIQLINPIDKKQPYDTSFGKVLQFGDNKLITYNSEILYVLHPGAVSIVSVLNSARKILDLAVNENEIFILEGERSLLRIGSLPDKYSLDLLYQPVSRRTSFNLDEFAAKIKDTAVESIKKITKDLIPSNEQTSPNSPPALADEALELPPIVNFPDGLMPTIFTAENIEIHSSVTEKHILMPFTNLNNSWQNNFEKTLPKSNEMEISPFNQNGHEEIITRPLRKRHNKKPKSNLQGSTLVSESESDTTSNLSEDRLVCGVANDFSLSDESAFSQSQSSFSVLRDISSLLGRPKATGNEVMKTSDTKSQTSLDTCESVSERLLLTSEAFREEQEKTFARLANQPLFDSFNSERTDNMSISLNMTTSSSFSSRVSENLPSPSYASDNSGAVSRTKSAESQNTDNFENDVPAISKAFWRWGSNFVEKNFSQEGSSGSSVSNKNSQQERLYPKWRAESEIGNAILDEAAGNSTDFPVNEFHALKDENSAENNHVECSFSQTISMNASSNLEKILNPSQVTKKHDCGINSAECPNQVNDLDGFSQSGDFATSEQLSNKGDGRAEKTSQNNEFQDEMFLSNEMLNYGPPSGSSMISSQPSSDFSLIPNASQIFQPQQDSFDHWPQYKTPKRITSLDACKNYVVCTDNKGRVYYSQLSGLSLSWTLLDYQASLVRVTNDGSAVWLLDKKSVSALIDPSLNSPVSEKFRKVAQDIKTFAIDSINNDVLMVTLAGKIINYNDKTDKREIPCNYTVADIACSGGLILAINNERSVLCKLPEEQEFRLVKTLKPITSIAIGPKNLVWVVDETNNIFFSDDFLTDKHHWWQIKISDYIFRNSPRTFKNNYSRNLFLNELKINKEVRTSVVATNDNSVWIFDKFDSCVFINKTGFTGYIWNSGIQVKISPSIEWQTLSAGGVSQETGRLWLLSADGSIFCIAPKDQKFQSVTSPCEENILCMTSLANTLWVLSGSGRIYSRLGLTSSNVSGTSWKEMKSPQIDNLRFVWISCGCDVAWACDFHGQTFITVGSPHHMHKLDPTWVEVEGRPKDVQFAKVFVGSHLYMVWAVDTNNNLYVREGIFPHYQIGTSWVYVCGIEATHVTISGTNVWALASDGSIYRRCGVSECNFIGDYWRSIPGNLKMISSSFTNELWSVNNENEIQLLNCSLKIIQEENVNTENQEISRSKEDISWEMVK